MGRKTKYYPELGDELISFCAETGRSETAFAGSKRMAPSALTSWKKIYPEFAEASEIARAARINILEETLLEATNGPQVSVRTLMLKQAAPEYRDKVMMDITSEDGSMSPRRELSQADLMAELEKRGLTGIIGVGADGKLLPK